MTGTEAHALPFEGLDGLSSLGAAWDELREASGADPLCNAHAWTVAHARAFGEAGAVFGWVIERSGKPHAIFAFREEPRRGRLALRRVRLAADGTFDSEYLTPLVRPGFEREAARHLVDALASRPAIEACVLATLPADAALLPALRDELEHRRLPRRERTELALVAELPSDLDTYLASLKPRMRTKVRSALRGLRERDARVATCDAASDLDAWLDGLFTLHQKRWQAAGRPGSFASDERRAFYRRMAADLLDRGALRFVRLEVSGTPVAYQIGAVLDGAYYQVQEGFAPEHEDLRIGLGLRALGIELLMEEGVSRYDFMLGDARHKRDWGAREKRCVTLAFALPRWRARLAYGLRGAQDRLERVFLAKNARSMDVHRSQTPS